LAAATSSGNLDVWRSRIARLRQGVVHRFFVEAGADEVIADGTFAALSPDGAIAYLVRVSGSTYRELITNFADFHR
jgi:hypothetical protein